LALIERQVEVPGLKSEFRVLIPKKAMSEILRMTAESEAEMMVEIAKDESHLFFSLGERCLISRMLTGQFPNYEAVLPRENTRVVEMDKDAVTAAMRRVALLADERSHAVRLQFDKDQVEVFASSGEYGEARETLEAAYQGEPMLIGFNCHYLLDFLGVLGEGGKVRVELKDEQSAGQLRPSDEQVYQYRYVVMPMRV
jgi:DNA polymerase-3 subunit beta